MCSTLENTDFPLESQDFDREIFLEIFQKLTLAERKIWGVIANFSKRYVSVFPSQKTIANLAQCTDRTVRRALTKFQSLNWVRVIRRRYSSCIYKINLHLLGIDTASSKTFLKAREEIKEKEKPQVRDFVATYLEKFTPTQKRIFMELQKRSVYRTSFFSYRSLAKVAKCSVSTIARFVKLFKELLGFILHKRGGRKSTFDIYKPLSAIDLRKNETFEMSTYAEKPVEISSRAMQVNESRFMLRRVRLNPKDELMISRYRPATVAKAVEDMETYKMRKTVYNEAAFLLSRCKAHSKKLQALS